MRIGTSVHVAEDFESAVHEVVELESAGLDVVHVPEAYSFDAVSRIGYLAARTHRVELASGVLQLYTRTPALTAMTAAGLDSVSGGRFTLGIGVSGPQVVEGFHGVPYDSPLARTRELVGICRQVWRREPLVHRGEHYRIPLPEGEGTGLGKPLKLINRPLRERIPITLAATGPRNVALAAEIAEGWQPIFYLPEQAADVWGRSLAEGAARRDARLGALDVVVPVTVAIGSEVDHVVDSLRPTLALYIGGMGARGRNFYHDLACRYGYEAEAKLVQDLYLAGRREEACAAVPRSLIEGISLIGPPGFVRERLAAFAESGVTTLSVQMPTADSGQRLRQFALLRDLVHG
ncbi:LLM class F420-dependent oxidoreductase [Actinosynnema sp. NPDC050436]|uniref:LLM class F420-dependent oxidoreductase n=1 Tax=Actinosynnema sp. NPDC050436 TaxID=3155659 RepID=UPI0033BFB967